jgi:hypothetical protein
MIHDVYMKQLQTGGTVISVRLKKTVVDTEELRVIHRESMHEAAKLIVY